MNFNLLVLGLFLNLVNLSVEQFEPKVTAGKVTFIGSYLESWSFDSIASFRGIRYAQPPTGNLRFKDPKPIVYNASIEYDATKIGSDCPSIYATNPSEDCLFLNVYVRNISKNSDSNSLRPVIAFIHPGGFYIGSSSSYGPEYLLTNDIVLVTFNYRLGTLGFLNFGTKDIPGNAGFKDQVIALRWIQQNIAAFGGDSQDITLMGYSAGGFSVSLHLVSPMSQGLFQRAIIMSGSIPPQMKVKQNQKNLAIKQANLLGCNVGTDSEGILECLNKFSGIEIASTLRSMFEFGKDNPIFLWQPVLDEEFLIENPFESFKSGNFNKVPTLIGFTNNELCTSAADILLNDSLREQFNENFSTLAPICFMYNDRSKEEMDLISEKLKRNYFSNEIIQIEKFPKLCELFSDSIIRFGAHRLAEIISNHNVSVYTYRFSYLGRYSNLNFAGAPRGAEHMDDLMYLFPTENIKFNQTDPEAEIVNMMVNLITSFIKTNSLSAVVEEPKSDFASNAYLEIQDTFELKQGKNFDRKEMWNELFPI